MLTVLLVAVWMPLTAHCQIERLTGWEALRCESAGTGAPSSGSHCDDGACCGLESGQYQLPPGQPALTLPLFAVEPPVLAMVDGSVPRVVTAGVLTAAPAGPPRPWQFLLRAALPVRAPSIAS